MCSIDKAQSKCLTWEKTYNSQSEFRGERELSRICVCASSQTPTIPITVEPVALCQMKGEENAWPWFMDHYFSWRESSVQNVLIGLPLGPTPSDLAE
jgi:hypothetical protein